MVIKDKLKQFPGLYNFVRQVNLKSNHLLKKLNILGRKNNIPMYGLDSLIKYGKSSQEVFFGYYDLSPFSKDSSKILACKVPPINSKSSDSNIMRVGFYPTKDTNSDFVELDNTETWCWQQGCRLQWFPSDDSNLIIFNKVVNNRYGSITKDIYTGEIINKYEFPIYCINTGGQYALTLNFSRLERLRPGYGYNNFSDLTATSKCPKSDGIYLADLENNKINLLYSLRQIKAIGESNFESGSEHYVNHLHFNKETSRFLFFHIWQTPKRRFIRLITSDIDGNNPYVLIESDLGLSHYCWKNNKEIIVYLFSGPEGKGYYLLKDLSCKIVKLEAQFNNIDGHPLVSSSGHYVYTDTTVDKYSERSIFRYDFKKKTTKKIIELYSPYEFRDEYRCDLHPRISSNDRYLAFDSAHTGKRQLYKIKL